MIPSLPPLSLRAGRAVAERTRAELHLAASLSDLSPEVGAALRAAVQRGAIAAPPTPHAPFARSFRSVLPDGRQTGRIPDGWDSDGICWSPFCCKAARTTTVDCCDAEPAEPVEVEASKCEVCEAKPFFIDIEEMASRCAPGDRAQYLEDNLELGTDLSLAAEAHATISAAAENLSLDGSAIGACKAAGIIAASRGGLTALWVPETYAYCVVPSGLGSWVDGEIVDGMGQPVVSVPGFPNLGPDGEPPEPGCFWMYGTSPFIDWAVTEIDADECVNRALTLGNTSIPTAGRMGIVRVDKCDVFAAQVAIPSHCEKVGGER